MKSGIGQHEKWNRTTWPRPTWRSIRWLKTFRRSSMQRSPLPPSILCISNIWSFLVYFEHTVYNAHVYNEWHFLLFLTLINQNNTALPPVILCIYNIWRFLLVYFENSVYETQVSNQDILSISKILKAQHQLPYRISSRPPTIFKFDICKCEIGDICCGAST